MQTRKCDYVTMSDRAWQMIPNGSTDTGILEYAGICWNMLECQVEFAAPGEAPDLRIRQPAALGLPALTCIDFKASKGTEQKEFSMAAIAESASFSPQKCWIVEKHVQMKKQRIVFACEL